MLDDSTNELHETHARHLPGHLIEFKPIVLTEPGVEDASSWNQSATIRMVKRYVHQKLSELHRPKCALDGFYFVERLARNDVAYRTVDHSATGKTRAYLKRPVRDSRAEEFEERIGD